MPYKVIPAIHVLTGVDITSPYDPLLVSGQNKNFNNFMPGEYAFKNSNKACFYDQKATNRTSTFLLG